MEPQKLVVFVTGTPRNGPLSLGTLTPINDYVSPYAPMKPRHPFKAIRDWGKLPYRMAMRRRRRRVTLPWEPHKNSMLESRI